MFSHRLGDRSTGTSNGSNGSAIPLLIHLDVNKTVIQSDSIQLKSIEDGVREGIAELFWGVTQKTGDKVTWDWTGAKASCSPPSEDIRNVGTTLQNYVQYCKEAVRDKKERKEAIKSWSLVENTPVKKEMDKLLALTMKKMQLPPDVRYSKDAEIAGLKGPTYSMFPSVFHMVVHLQKSNRQFGIIFRSFGKDHEKIKTEWNAFCERKHPIFNRLTEDIGAMDGTVQGVPDRRIHGLHTLYRDQQGPVLLLDTFTNGPEQKSWDSWVKSSPPPKSDFREGREFIRRELKCKTVEGMANVQKWMGKTLAAQQTAAIKDDWAWWQFKGETAEAGKLLTLIPRIKSHQVFFDDNIDHKDCRIVDCRDEKGAAIPPTTSLNKYCVKVNPVEASLDNDYFYRLLLRAQGHSLDVGASMLGLQKQLTEVEEEKADYAKQVNDLNHQLKTLMQENRRMKLQRRINVRDEGELSSLLSKYNDIDLSMFDQQGFRSISELYFELDQGHCGLEVNESETIVRVIDMLFLKIQFKDLILIETHEQDWQQRVHTRNYLPGITANVKESSAQQELQSWLEIGLGVNLAKCVEVESHPVHVPSAPNQQTGASKSYPMQCVIQQSQGTYTIPEKEADLNKDVLAKIGLPNGKHFTSQEKDLHGGTITRFWRWDKKATWEASAGLAGKEGRPPLDVAAACDKVFQGNTRANEYKKLLLQMFEIFEPQMLAGGFSGSVVLRVQPFEADGRPTEPCIVKLDAGKAIREEYVNSVNVFEALPDRAARILGDPAYETNADGQEFGAMRLELAGACWNVPELAQGSANLLCTFKDLLVYESEQTMLSGSVAASDDSRPFGNVNSILAETFGPGGVVSSLRKGGNGLRRAEKKPLTGMSWYTLKGKKTDFSLYETDKKTYPPGDVMRRLYKDIFKTDLPKLKDKVIGEIKPTLEKLEKSSARELWPLVGLAHGDLNAANIMIDALEAVWVIDFATSVELPLFTDMCKFEMACLFEYSIIPITPKLLVEFTSNSEQLWQSMNVRDWLGVDQDVCNHLLQKFHGLPSDRLHSLSQSDLDALIEEAVGKCPKPHKQQKYERSLKSRLTADEAVTTTAFQYCMNISDTLLQGDQLGQTLEIKGLPLPDGRGSRGALALRFFMDICVSIRRFMAQDVNACLREQKQAGDLMPVDWLSLQMWLPILRESFRIIGYRDIAPQYKVWAIYHCQKVSQNVQRILEKIQKNLGKLHTTDILSSLLRELELGKSTMRREKTDFAVLEKSDLQHLQTTSHWVRHYHGAFPQNAVGTSIVRGVHKECATFGSQPGFFSPVWQVVSAGSEDGQGFKLEFSSGEAGLQQKPSVRGGQQLDLCIVVPSEAIGAPWQHVPIGTVHVGKGAQDTAVALQSRLLPLSGELLRLVLSDARTPDASVNSQISTAFSLNDWSGGVVSNSGALQGESRAPPMMNKSNLIKLDGSASSVPHSSDMIVFRPLEAVAVDANGRQKMRARVILGIPVWCYPPGSNLCVDRSAEGLDQLQLRSPSVVVRGLTERGQYVLRSALDPSQETEVRWDPTPSNHTFILPRRYDVGQSVLVTRGVDDFSWVDATVVQRSADETNWQYKIKMSVVNDGQPAEEHRHLDPMNSGRVVSGVTAEMFEEETHRFKAYLRARSSCVIDSLSGAKLNVKECAPPTLQTKGVSFGVKAGKGLGKTTQRSLSATNSNGEDNDGGPQRGWKHILKVIETFERGEPSYSSNAFLILGSPGSGKTCMVSRLIMEVVDRYTNIMPLLLSVADLVRRSTPDPELCKLDPSVIHDWFDKYLRITFGEDSSRYLMICQAIKMNRVMFIFEGLEDSAELKEVIECCIKLRMQERHLVFVTSRPLIGGQSTLEDISECIVAMNLDNLSNEQIRMVAHTRLGISGIDAFDSLFAKLNRSGMDMDNQASTNGPDGEKQEEVFGNPMMLSMLLCYLQTMQKKEAEKKEAQQRGEDHEDQEEHEEKDEANITSVYRVAIDVMLQRVLSKSQADRHNKDEKMEAFKRILEHIALHMTLNGQGGEAMMASEVEHILPKELVQTWETLQKAVIAGHAMFLRAQGETGKEELRFLVKDFQNFFSASAVAHARKDASQRAVSANSLPELTELLTQPAWSKMLEMLAEAWPNDYVKLIERRLERFQATDGDSYLHIAARAGHMPIFRLLTLFNEQSRKALHKRSQDQQTPLHVAAEKGYTRLCFLMIEAGAQIDVVDSTDCLPMHVALRNGNFQTAKMFLQKWTDTMTIEYKNRVRHNRFQAESLAGKVMKEISEGEFRKVVNEIFVELQYFGDKFSMDNKKTIGSLLAVYWICANQYDLFVRSQAADKLTKPSWQALQDWTVKTVGLTKNMKALGAMLVYVAISSLGKVKPLLEAFVPDIDAPGEGITAILQRHPILVPSFMKLEEGLQQTIVAAVKAESDFNLGQFLQAENFPANLLTVKQISNQTGAGNIDILGFLFFRILVMMCGILGFKCMEGSIFMTDKQYGNYRVGLDVLSHLRSETVQQVYNRFLQERSRPQELAFSASDPANRALVRLACLTRAFDKKVAHEVAAAWSALDADSRKALMDFVNRDGVDQKPAFLLFNSPNLMCNAKNNGNVGLVEAMKMLLEIYRAAEQKYINTQEAVVTIACDGMAQHTNEVKDTESYQNTNFEITRAAGNKSDRQGTVHRSPWQPINDQSMLDNLSKYALQLAHDTMHASVREPAFLKRLPGIFLELKYLTAEDDPISKKYYKETLLALLTTYWAVSRQESSFNRSQEAEKKLTTASWRGIQDLIEKAGLHANQEAVNAVFVAMAVCHLGRLPKLKQQLAPDAADHRQVMARVFETSPKVLPSFWRLSPQYRQLVQECLTRQFDFGKFLDAELIPASLTTLKDMLSMDRGGDLTKNQYLHLYMSTVFMQMSATGGQQSLEGSLHMTQGRWTEFQLGLNALLGLDQGSEQLIYERFLQARSEQMGLPCHKGDPDAQAVVRVACLCAIRETDSAPLVREAFDQLDAEERSRLVVHLTADGIDQKPGFILSDARAYLTAALANKQVGLEPALRILLKVYQRVAIDFPKGSKSIVTINMEKLATFAKSFTGSVTFEDLPFEIQLHAASDTVLVIPKVWIPVKNQSVLDQLKKKGKDLAGDLISGKLTEKSFMSRVHAAFPELSYLDTDREKKDQTVCAMLAVFWLVRDQYHSFVRGQQDKDEDQVLSRQSWAWVQDWMKNEVKLVSEEAIDAILTFMAIHALGKISEFRKELAPSFDNQAHDPALASILESQPEVVPSYQRLPDRYKRLIKDSLSVDFKFNQFVQAENVAANLVLVKEKMRPHGDDGIAFFCFRIFVQMCGKLGAKSMQGSLFMTEQQLERFRPGLDALQQLRTREASTAYNAFLLLQGAKALSRFASPEHKALSRLLCLGSASDIQAGNEICEAFDQLKPSERAKLIRMLTADGVEQKPGYVLCGAPELLSASQANDSVGLVAALRMMVRSQEKCKADASMFKMYIHLEGLAEWAKDAGSAEEFGQARLGFTYEDQYSMEDSTKTRVYRIEVSRPHSVESGNLFANRSQDCCQGFAAGLRCAMSVVGVLIVIAAAISAVAVLVRPDVLDSVLPQSVDRGLAAYAMLAFCFFVMLFYISRSCRQDVRETVPSARASCCDRSSNAEQSRPLLCCSSADESPEGDNLV